jgi:hypothetical protein
MGLKTEVAVVVVAQGAFLAVTESHGKCDVTSAEVLRLVKGSAVIEFTYRRKPTLFRFAFHRVLNGGVYDPLFVCESTQATLKPDVSKTKAIYRSPDLRCRPTCQKGEGVCSPILLSVLDQVGKGGDTAVTCDVNSKVCMVSEKVLNTLFVGGVGTSDCIMGECVFPGTNPDLMVEGVDQLALQTAMSFDQKMTVVMGFIYVAAAAAVTLIAIGFLVMSRDYACWNACSKTLAKGGGAPSACGMLNQAGTTYNVAMSNVTYKIKEKEVLKGVSGVALSGELLAIMGYGLLA